MDSTSDVLLGRSTAVDARRVPAVYRYLLQAPVLSSKRR